MVMLLLQLIIVCFRSIHFVLLPCEEVHLQLNTSIYQYIYILAPAAINFLFCSHEGILKLQIQILYYLELYSLSASIQIFIVNKQTHKECSCNIIVSDFQCRKMNIPKLVNCLQLMFFKLKSLINFNTLQLNASIASSFNLQ